MIIKLIGVSIFGIVVISYALTIVLGGSEKKKEFEQTLLKILKDFIIFVIIFIGFMSIDWLGVKIFGGYFFLIGVVLILVYEFILSK